MNPNNSEESEGKSAFMCEKKKRKKELVHVLVLRAFRGVSFKSVYIVQSVCIIRYYKTSIDIWLVYAVYDDIYKNAIIFRELQ